MNTGEIADIFTETAVIAICTGPAGSILGSDMLGYMWRRAVHLALWVDPIMK